MARKKTAAAAAVITIYSTKAALTKGIRIEKATILDDVSGGAQLADGTVIMRENKWWHRTPEAALAEAERMRTAMLDRYRKATKELKAKVFTIPEDSP